mmetsp:Transcript_10305/g.13774  ORF Transcript_10305/g.13774 Transcript_10305/m.13774 type:complete len:94 (-) Transcript_10305:59-340(-)
MRLVSAMSFNVTTPRKSGLIMRVRNGMIFIGRISMIVSCMNWRKVLGGRRYKRLYHWQHSLRELLQMKMRMKKRKNRRVVSDYDDYNVVRLGI